MEHCPGGSLAQKLRKKQPMDAAEWVNQAVRWLLQLCDTLAAVHARGWVHHDIKPANILLRDGMAVIADFGIVNTTGGTVTYSSPSKGMGLAQRDDPREDIYALGVTLLELLNHSHPWHGLEGNALEAAKRQRTLPADLDARTWLLEIALRAAHPEGALRFQTAADMGSALRARSVPVRVGQGHETVNPLSPLFLVYMQANGALRYNFTAPKQVLEIFRALCQGQTQPHEVLCKLFDQQTKHGQTAGCNQGHQEPRRL
ncbi:MAG: protein kinase, partial [Hydrogenophaga sp.]|nr:protein kinase [Hydrogenophaga sp.]